MRSNKKAKKIVLSFLYTLKKSLVSTIFLFVSTISIFFYGSNLTSTKCQVCAESFSRIAERDNRLPIVSIYDSEKSTGLLFSDHYYGFEQFHSGHNVFAGYNCDKSKKSMLYYDESSKNLDCFTNLTLVTTRGLSIQKDDDGNYKNSYYDFNLMFSSYGKGDGYSTSCLITESQAKELLVITKLKSFHDLLGLKLTYETSDRPPIELTIFNIIYESGKEFERFSSNVGNFFLANDWEFLRKPFLDMYYYMDSIAFENYHYLNMIKSAYNSSSITGSLINHSSSPKEIQTNSESFNEFLGADSNLSFGSIIFLICAIVCFCIALWKLISTRDDYFFAKFIICVTTPLIPYLIFKLIYIITKIPYFFSYHSLVGLLILELLLFLILSGIYLFRKRKTYAFAE